MHARFARAAGAPRTSSTSHAAACGERLSGGSTDAGGLDGDGHVCTTTAADGDAEGSASPAISCAVATPPGTPAQPA